MNVLSKYLADRIVVSSGDSWLRRREQVFELRKEQRKIKDKILKDIKRKKCPIAE